jgi:3-hydroxybutyryl-CoA dehydrogenase
MYVRKIGVVGAGTIGRGIAELAISKGFEVVINDISTQKLNIAIADLQTRIDQMVAMGKMSEPDKKDALRRLRAAPDHIDLKGADIIIEAVDESYEQKSKAFRQIDRTVSPDTVIASNTSSISINKLASILSHPHRFIGMHFLNPVPDVALVEIVRGLQTSEPTYALIVSLANHLGKSSITVNGTTGSAVTRILLPMINEAFFVLDESDLTAADIDNAMKLGCDHPVGPLALADAMGLDVVLGTIQALYGELSEAKYRPCPLLKEMVAAGNLGRKTGRGVYDYSYKPI